jgi:hypothetical protein
MTAASVERAATIDPEPAIVNLVPMLDPYTMGYKDRRRLLDPVLNETVIDRGGNMTSVILVDGRVVGVWDLVEAPTATARVLLFEPDHPCREAVLQQAAAVAAFWFGAAADVEEYASMVPLRYRSGVMRRPLDGGERGRRDATGGAQVTSRPRPRPAGSGSRQAPSRARGGPQ